MSLLDYNDQNPSIFPNQIDTCNGLDDDCDGQVDEEGSSACVDKEGVFVKVYVKMVFRISVDPLLLKLKSVMGSMITMERSII